MGMANPEVASFIQNLLTQKDDDEKDSDLSSPQPFVPGKDYSNVSLPGDPNSSYKDAPNLPMVASLEPVPVDPGILPSNPPPPSPSPSAPSQATQPRTPAVVPQSTSDLVSQAISQKYGYGPGLDSDALQNAQAQARQTSALALLGEAGDQIGHSIARQQGPVDNSFYQALQKQAEAPIQNIQQLRQAKLQDVAAGMQLAANDPNSPVSRGVQDAYIRLGFPESSVRQLGANDLKDIQGPAELQAKLDAQKEMKELQLSQMKAMKDIALGQKGTDKIAAAYKDTMNDKVVSQAKAQLAQADELRGATDDATSNPVSANALAALAARYVSGGQRINRQEMEALGGGAKDLSDKLSQIVQTGQKGTLTPENAAFMRTFIDVTGKTAQQTYQNAIKDRADSYADIYGVDPQDLYRKFGVNSRTTNSPQVPNASSVSNDPKIASWAKQNGLPYDQAQAILKRRGYGG